MNDSPLSPVPETIITPLLLETAPVDEGAKAEIELIEGQPGTGVEEDELQEPV